MSDFCIGGVYILLPVAPRPLPPVRHQPPVHQPGPG